MPRRTQAQILEQETEGFLGPIRTDMSQSARGERRARRWERITIFDIRVCVSTRVPSAWKKKTQIATNIDLRTIQFDHLSIAAKAGWYKCKQTSHLRLP